MDLKELQVEGADKLNKAVKFRRYCSSLFTPDDRAAASPDATVHSITAHCSRPTIVLQPHPTPSPLPTPEPPSGSACASARRLLLLLAPSGSGDPCCLGSFPAPVSRLTVAGLCPLPSQSAWPCLLFRCWSLVPVLLLLSCRLIIMAASSSSTVNQTEIGAARTENVPMQVINLRLTKENYFSWSPAMTMGIAARDRMTYIDGSNPEPARTSAPDPSDEDCTHMWVVLEQMYGQKKTDIRTYQVMKTVYNLRQGSSSVAEYYGALTAKWEELDYHSDLPWHCPQDQALHVAQEWKNRVFLFLAGLNDEFEGVRSQILNSGEVYSIEDVYSCVEAEEQRRLVTNAGKRDLVPSYEQSALVSRGSGNLTRSLRRCTHCKKTGHTVDYCWDLHPDKKGTRGRPSSGKMPMTEVPKPNGEKLSISADQLLVDVPENKEGCNTSIEKEGAPRLFGQVYSRREKKKTVVVQAAAAAGSDDGGWDGGAGSMYNYDLSTLELRIDVFGKHVSDLVLGESVEVHRARLDDLELKDLKLEAFWNNCERATGFGRPRAAG
ncbi:hypothetical protein EJ110_NYTH54106 [Nymphaea thermarum]|nr:hypothetical protein EJ110_NYTH54106 [Nymphaea thermarum]